MDSFRIINTNKYIVSYFHTCKNSHVDVDIPTYICMRGREKKIEQLLNEFKLDC